MGALCTFKNQHKKPFETTHTHTHRNTRRTTKTHLRHLLFLHEVEIPLSIPTAHSFFLRLCVLSMAAILVQSPLGIGHGLVSAYSIWPFASQTTLGVSKLELNQFLNQFTQALTGLAQISSARLKPSQTMLKPKSVRQTI